MGRFVDLTKDDFIGKVLFDGFEGAFGVGFEDYLNGGLFFWFFFFSFLF